MIKKFLCNLFNIKENKVENKVEIEEETKPDFDCEIYLPENWHYKIIYDRYVDIDYYIAVDIDIYYKNTFVFTADYNRYSKDIENVYKESYYESVELYNKIQEIVEYNTNERKKIKLNKEIEILKMITN